MGTITDKNPDRCDFQNVTGPMGLELVPPAYFTSYSGEIDPDRLFNESILICAAVRK